MILGTHNKQPREVRRLMVDYNPWLAAAIGETLVNVYVRADIIADPPSDAPAAETLDDPWAIPPLAVAAAVDDTHTFVVVTVSGGVSYTDYRVSLLATTSTGQIKEDEIVVSVQEVS